MEQQKWLKFIFSPKMDTWWLIKGESKINISVVFNKVIKLIRRSKETIVVMYRLNIFTVAARFSFAFFATYCLF